MIMKINIKNNFLRVLLNIAITFGIGYVIFYLMLPPLNFCAPEFYFFVIILSVVYMFTSAVTSGFSAKESTEGKV